MKLINLHKYTDNNSDEVVLDTLTKSKDEELINYVSNVTSDFLNNVFLSEEFKSNAKKNISKFNGKEIGELSVYMAITPYVQATLVKTINNWQDKATAFLENYIGYIIGTVSKDVFLNNLTENSVKVNLLGGAVNVEWSGSKDNPNADIFLIGPANYSFTADYIL